MSWRRPTQVEQRELEVACKKCGADPNEWCYRISEHADHAVTNPIAYLHRERFDAATAAGLLPLGEVAL